MEKSKKINEVELRPLNDDLYDEFSIQELEQRLETKPWICGIHGDECGVDDVEIPTGSGGGGSDVEQEVFNIK